MNRLPGSVLLISMTLVFFGAINSNIANSFLNAELEGPLPLVTLSVSGGNLSFFHKGGYSVGNWSLFVNNTLVKTGSDFHLGDCIIYNTHSNYTGWDCCFVGDNNILFWCSG